MNTATKGLFIVDETQATATTHDTYGAAVAHAHAEAMRTGYASEISLSANSGFYLIALVYPDGTVSKC